MTSVRYRVCIHNVVCVPHCYLRKRPGPKPRFSLSKLSTLACCTCGAALCAYYTTVSVQTANQIGVCSVGLSLVDRSGVWSSLLAPLTSGGQLSDYRG